MRSLAAAFVLFIGLGPAASRADDMTSASFRLRGATVGASAGAALQDGSVGTLGGMAGQPGPIGVSEGGTGMTLVTLRSGFWHVLGGTSRDSDGDGVPDTGGAGPCTTAQTSNCFDNCPFEPNNSVEDTQLDSDGNGRGDACECGNADGNTRRDIFDALHIAQGTLTPPLVTLIHPRACDADGNGTCDIFDALRVAQATLSPPLAEIVQECEAATVVPVSP